MVYLRLHVSTIVMLIIVKYDRGHGPDVTFHLFFSYLLFVCDFFFRVIFMKGTNI